MAVTIRLSRKGATKRPYYRLVAADSVGNQIGGVMDMKELITYIAKALVDKPEEVTVTEIEGEQTSVIELKVAKEDLGKVIGKQGRTARAMRTILSAASTKIRKRAVLEILE